MNRLRVCLVGFGYWGPNLARNIVASDSFELTFVLELDKSKHAKISQLYPTTKLLTSLEDLVNLEDQIDVGVIATPTLTHFELAKTFLNMGCHIWVEKPLTNNYGEAMKLLEIAATHNLKIFVDHTFLYTSAIGEIKSLTSQIGDITYINSTRSNFGIIQSDSSVIWDLAVHDVSIVNYLVKNNPISVMATASTPFPGIQKSVATLLINYGKFFCTIHVNWLSPFKIRDFVLGGTSKSIHFDDTKTEDKVKVYAQSIEDLPGYTKKDIRLYDYKYGQIVIPDIGNNEALGNAFKQFATYIDSNLEPPSSGQKSIEVIRILTAAEESIQRGGIQIDLDNMKGAANHV
jgi:predicted dehydrogenase